MANVAPNLNGLKRGNTKNVGRKPSEIVREREAFFCDPSLKSVAMQGLRNLLRAGDPATVRWFWDHLYGKSLPQANACDVRTDDLLYDMAFQG